MGQGTARRRGNYQGPPVALFLGAGASVSSGLPSYDDLRTAVARAVRTHPPSESPDELPRLAQLLAMADTPEGPGRIQVLGDLMLTDTGPEVPHQVAQAALASGEPVLTVNWDDLVERACARIGIIPTADKSELTESLGSLAAGSHVSIHGSVESFPLLLAWGSAHGLDLTAYERPQPDQLSAVALITPRIDELGRDNRPKAA